MKVLDTSITISRPLGGNDDRVIKITLRDNTSCSQFAEVEISLADFSEAITGLAHIPCKTTVRGLENVGLVKERETATAYISNEEYETLIQDANVSYEGSKRVLGDWLEANYQREGWLIDKYLGSQGSVTYVDGGKKLWFAYFRYVEGKKDE